MSDVVLTCTALGKRYDIGRQMLRKASFREAVVGACGRYAGAVARFASRKGPRQDAESTLWALSDVSFSLNRGDVLGVIGGNGAGKSTLLKILTRVTKPSAGSVRIKGSVGALLEVGTGFHHELTGRENVFLAGAILGMTKREVTAKFDAIVDFAGVARFLDTPVKRYSSGMYMRLAFAVAAHLEPDILIVDEVLAVGDTQFQRKCLGKMGDVARQGRTVVFVSHNMSAIQKLCHRVLWLKSGSVQKDGPPAEVVSAYLRSSLENDDTYFWPDPATAPGNNRVRIRRMSVQAADGSPSITTATEVTIVIEYWSLDAGPVLTPVAYIYNEDDTLAFVAAPAVEAAGRTAPAGLYRDVWTIPANLLNTGVHSVELQVSSIDAATVFRCDDTLVFSVADGDGQWHREWPGAVRPQLAWHSQAIEEDGDGLNDSGSCTTAAVYRPPSS